MSFQNTESELEKNKYERNNMIEEKELSPFLQKMKDAYLSRKENPEIIRPEDMRDEEYLRYTIRKKWREEKKRSRG
jgi:hypothetical protein